MRHERETAAAYARILHRQIKSIKEDLVAQGYSRDAVYMVVLSTVARVLFEDEGLDGVTRRAREFVHQMEEWGR